jgi:hypothetical protein
MNRVVLTTPLTRSSSRHHQQGLLDHFDDDELLKNKPIRIKEVIIHPRGNLKLRELGKRRNLKLAKVRVEKHKGNE